mgnify:CR=1 FL=1
MILVALLVPGLVLIAAPVVVEHISLQRIPVSIHVQMDSMAILQIGNVIVRNCKLAKFLKFIFISKPAMPAVLHVLHQAPAVVLVAIVAHIYFRILVLAHAQTGILLIPQIGFALVINNTMSENSMS